MTTALDAALAAITVAVPADDPNPAHQLAAATCRALLIGYDARWAGQEWRAVELERTTHLPIINPDTGRRSRTWTQAGKRDGVIVGYGRRMLLELKTVGNTEDLADPASPFWRRLAIDAQVSAYMLQAWQEGEKLDGALYDVVRKPGIRPKALAKTDWRSIVTTKRWHGFELSPDLVAMVAAGTVNHESQDLELYTCRLAAECIAEPARYYQRKAIPRLDADMLDWARELWEIGQEILGTRNTERHFRNSAACMDYGRPCEFLGVCSGFDAIDSDRWERSGGVHAELELAPEVDQRTVLTHSRIKCYQACRRRHFYRYELGARRHEEHEAEALYIGTLFHKAAEAWWLNQPCAESAQGEGNATASYCPATAVGQPVAVAAS